MGFKKRYSFEICDKRRKADSLETLFTEFHKLQDKYCEEMEFEDAIFGYTEMSNVALLSAAAIKLNWHSVCEYQSLKQSKLDGRKDSYGRVDLYYYDSEGYGWLVEAKQIGRRDFNIVGNKEFAKKHADVTADIKRTINARNRKVTESGYSVLFVPHYISKKKSKHGLDENIQSFKTNLSQFSYDNKAFAWSYYNPKNIIADWTDFEDLIGLGSIITRV